jgi:hypothetical protein
MIPGLSLYSNPGLELANAFGVKARIEIANAFGVISTGPASNGHDSTRR